MKRKIKILLISIFLVILPLIIVAQSPPHPNGGSAPTGANGPVGGGAPIDGSIWILLILGIIYSAKKTITLQKKLSE
jgi:hypothetical protein